VCRVDATSPPSSANCAALSIGHILSGHCGDFRPECLQLRRACQMDGSMRTGCRRVGSPLGFVELPPTASLCSSDSDHTLAFPAGYRRGSIIWLSRDSRPAEARSLPSQGTTYTIGPVLLIQQVVRLRLSHDGFARSPPRGRRRRPKFHGRRVNPRPIGRRQRNRGKHSPPAEPLPRPRARSTHLNSPVKNSPQRHTDLRRDRRNLSAHDTDEAGPQHQKHPDGRTRQGEDVFIAGAGECRRSGKFA